MFAIHMYIDSFTMCCIRLTPLSKLAYSHCLPIFYLHIHMDINTSSLCNTYNLTCRSWPLYIRTLNPGNSVSTVSLPPVNTNTVIWKNSR